MKKRTFLHIFLAYIFSTLIYTNAFAFENLFYTMRYTAPAAQSDFANVFKILNDHSRQIQVLASQAYVIKPDGSVSGGFNPIMLSFAKKNKIKFMALVSNPGAQERLTHVFLQNRNAREFAIQALLKECMDNQLYGIQVDFENVAVADKDLLTSFYQDLARRLHQSNFAISIAITPRIVEGEGNSAFQSARFKHWTGAFDYKALGKSSDFVTLMAYDQHVGATTPGPVASINWSEAIIKHALKFIPAQKISLGIPTYSGFWKTAKRGNSILANGQQIEFNKMQKLLEQYHQTLRWDENQKIYYTFYENDELNEFIFAEEARSFAAKYNLAKKYNLRGVSVWRLGIEDPKIWNVIK